MRGWISGVSRTLKQKLKKGIFVIRYQDARVRCVSGGAEFAARKRYQDWVQRKCNGRERCNFNANSKSVSAQHCPSKPIYHSLLTFIINLSHILDNFVVTISYICSGGIDNSHVKVQGGGSWVENTNRNRQPNQCNVPNQPKKMDVTCGRSTRLSCDRGCLQ